MPWQLHHITSANADSFPYARPLLYVAGMDISFVKDDAVNACAALVVIRLPDYEVMVIYNLLLYLLFSFFYLAVIYNHLYL